MSPVKLIGLGLIVSAFGACASTPPSPPPPDYRGALLQPCANAADTAPWVLVDEWADGDVYRPETQFRDDGVLIYAYDGRTYDNGRWSLEGIKLHMDTNDHYADYHGVFDGEHGTGTMKNEPGNAGTWKLERDCKS